MRFFSQNLSSWLVKTCQNIPILAINETSDTFCTYCFPFISSKILKWLVHSFRAFIIFSIILSFVINLLFLKHILIKIRRIAFSNTVNSDSGKILFKCLWVTFLCFKTILLKNLCSLEDKNFFAYFSFRVRPVDCLVFSFCAILRTEAWERHSVATALCEYFVCFRIFSIWVADKSLALNICQNQSKLSCTLFRTKLNLFVLSLTIIMFLNTYLIEILARN